MGKYDAVEIQPSDFEDLSIFCVGCQASKLLQSDERSGLRYSCCGACGLVFMNPMPTESFYKRFYSGAYWDLTGRNLEPRLRKQVGRALMLSKAFKELEIDISGSRLVDVGAGLGGVSFALQRIWDVKPTTLEPDETSSKISARLGNNLLTKGISVPFDVLVLMHVLEHQRDPIDFLLDNLRLVRDGGLICIEVPNGREIRDGGIDHPLVFTPKSLEQTLAQLGYESSIILHRGHGKLFGRKKYLLCLARKKAGNQSFGNRPELFKGYGFGPENQSWFMARVERILAPILLRKSFLLEDQLTKEALTLTLDNPPAL